MKEVTANTMCACDLRALSDLCAVANMGERATVYKARAGKVGAAILAYCYDMQSAAFYDAKAGSNEKLEVLSAMSFLPLLLPEIPSDICSEMVSRHLINEQEFSCQYPIPSVAMNDLSFCAEETYALWRGPTWPVMNWLLYSCLRKRGFAALAKRLRESVARLIQKSGFTEYYNPLTGEGYGAKDFTWAGLIVDMESF